MSLVESILVFQGKYNGKDRFGKTLAGLIKFWSYFSKQNKVAEDLTARLLKLAAAISQARKLFRFGNSVNDANNAKAQLFKYYNGSGDLWTLVALNRSLFMILYLLFEHQSILSKLGVLVGKDAVALERRSAAFWAVALFCGLISELRNHNQITERAQGGADQRKVAADLLKSRLALTKNVFDLTVAFNTANFVNLNDAIIGFANTLSGSIGIWEIWEWKPAK